MLKPQKDICPEFYDFIFHTEVYKQQVNRQSTGIVSDRNRLYWDSFKQMPNLTLPPTEQKEIVAFIAKETAALNLRLPKPHRLARRETRRHVVRIPRTITRRPTPTRPVGGKTIRREAERDNGLEKYASKTHKKRRGIQGPYTVAPSTSLLLFTTTYRW